MMGSTLGFDAESRAEHMQPLSNASIALAVEIQHFGAAVMVFDDQNDFRNHSGQKINRLSCE